MGRLIGYARVSKDSQDLALQKDALQEAGCLELLIFMDKVSGSKEKRPGLDMCLKELKEGDTLLVWRLDRLGRSMSHLVNLVEELLQRKVGFRSICDGAIDTTSASGELIFNIFSALAQFEKRMIQERTAAGLKAARARGKKGGRKPITNNDPKVKAAVNMYQNKTMPIQDICKTLNISRATLYRYINISKKV